MSAKQGDPNDDEGGLDFGTGWSRWAEYQALHGGGEDEEESSEIPQDWPDTQLVAWVNQTRRDYWRFQNGENTYLKQGGFAMLGKCGFDFGPNPNGDSDEVVEPKKKKSKPKKTPAAKPTATGSAKKPAAAKRRGSAAAAAAASKEDSDDGDDDDDEEEEASPPTRRSTRRRSSVSTTGQDSAVVVASSSAKRKRGDDDTDTDNAASDEEEDSKPAARSSRRKAKSNKSEESLSSRYPRRNRTVPDPSPVSSSNAIVATSSTTGKRKATPAASAAGANKRVKTENTPTKTHWKDYNTRQLVRVIPKEQEDQVRQQIQKDSAKLLESQELMVADKAQGVDYQLAKSNVAWEECFLDFLVFHKMFGHGIVPKMFKENEALGRWTARNRRWYKCNDKRLTKSRLKRLEKAGFVWDAKKDPMYWTVQNQTTQAAAKWESRFHNLLTYKEEHGDCLVPKEYAPNMILSRWVADMRKQYKNKKAGNKFSTLDDEREERLNDVGFVWNTRTKAHMRLSIMKRFEDKWMDCFNKLIEFKKTYGHTGVPRRWNDDPALASWAMRQRSLGRKKEAGEDSFLTDERYELLKSVDFIFNLDRRMYPMSGGASANQAGADDGDGADDGEDKEEEEAVALAEDDEQAIAVAVEVPVDNVESQTPVAEVVRDLDNDNADTEGEGLTTPAAAAASLPEQTPSSASVEGLTEKESINETLPSPPLPDKKRRAKTSKSQAKEEKKRADTKKVAGDKSTAVVEEGKEADGTSKTAAEVAVRTAAAKQDDKTMNTAEVKAASAVAAKEGKPGKKTATASVAKKNATAATESMNTEEAKKAAVADVGSKSAVKDSKVSSADESTKKKVGPKAKAKPESDDAGMPEGPTAPGSATKKKDEKDASHATGSTTSRMPNDNDNGKTAALGQSPKPRRKKRQKGNYTVEDAKGSVDSSTQAMPKAPVSLTNRDSGAPSVDVKNSTSVKEDVKERKTTNAASAGSEAAAHDKAASKGNDIKANNASTETAPAAMSDTTAAAVSGLVELQAEPSEPSFVEAFAHEASSAGLQRLKLSLDSPL